MKRPKKTIIAVVLEEGKIRKQAPTGSIIDALSFLDFYYFLGFQYFFREIKKELFLLPSRPIGKLRSTTL